MRRDTRTATTSYRLSGGAALLAIAMTLTACAGSSKSTSAATGNTSAALATPSSSSSSSPASSTSADPTSPDTASVSTAAAPVGGGGSFCDEARREQTIENEADTAFTGTDTASLKAFEEKVAAELPTLVAKAPAEIKGDIEVLAAAQAKLFSALEAANFSNTAVPSQLAGLDTPEIEQASTAIDTYLSKTCGITVSDSPSS